MNFFRNKDVRLQLILCLLVTLLFVVAGVVISPLCAVFAASAGAYVTAVSLLFTYRRMKKIADMSDELDMVLHGKQSFDFSDYSEGELAVLHNTLQKMLMRLREQASALEDDKVFLSDTMADISHQLRTPLTSINLIVTMLSDKSLPENKHDELYMELKRLLSRTDALVTSLLKLSRLDAGTVRYNRVEMTGRELVRLAAETVAVPMELKNQRLTVSGDETVLHIDREWTAEAFSNILKNCMEHTPDGGEIKVDFRETGIFSQIVISDNGPGFDEIDIPHLFERFYSGKNSVGFGIGLAFARMIIVGQNGTIKAGNISSGGAEFSVKFYKTTV